MSDKLARIPIEISVYDQKKIRAELNRLTAPLTVGEILKKIPIRGRVHKVGNALSIIVGIQKGIEKPIKNVKAGTIAYWPRGDALQIYIRDTKTQGLVNKIGEIKEGINDLLEIKSSTPIELKRS